MLEKIKKLLDSGCWVEVLLIYGDKPFTIVGYNDDYFIDIMIGQRDIMEEAVKSIKPIARPLYQYNVGDKVVVLDNYEEESLIGKTVEIDDIQYGAVSVLNNDKSRWSDIWIDIRCIAPVLD